MGTRRLLTAVALVCAWSGAVGCPVTLYAQDRSAQLSGLTVLEPGRLQLLVTASEERHVGRVVEVGADEVHFETDDGALVIPIDQIASVEEISASDIRDGQYWFPNPNATRLFFSPTGRMLSHGEGYFADYYIFFPSVAFGLTDQVTVGAGMSLFPEAGFGEQLLCLTPKVGIEASERTHVAAGALIVRIPTWGDDDFGDSPSTVGILYGVSTFGSPNTSATIGLGYGFVDSDLANKPMIVLGGGSAYPAASPSSRRTGYSPDWTSP
ncbi:MAG: hypothetical protein EXR92_02065 [Gemmatimonadetes bacterium]|nr:hypothetical protein [Gemmatimonadota bacterium]